MEKLTKQITLLHLLVAEKKMIGLKFYPDKVIHALIKDIPDVRWSKEFNMAVLPNHKNNLDLIFNLFKGIAWVNCTRFFTNRPIKQGQEAPNVDWYRKRKITSGFRVCPESYLQKLELHKVGRMREKHPIPIILINLYREVFQRLNWRVNLN